MQANPNANDRDKAEGTIAAIKKETHVWDQEECVDITSHPVRINSSGKIEYAQKCHAIKPLVVTRFQDPITLSDLAATLVKTGMWVRFVVAEHGGKDKTDQRLWDSPSSRATRRPRRISTTDRTSVISSGRAAASHAQARPLTAPNAAAAPCSTPAGARTPKR